MLTMILAALLAPAPPQAAAAQAAGRRSPDARAPAEIVVAAPAADWRAVAAEDLLVMELAPGADGRARRVTVQLIAPPFSQGWVQNIRTLARARWWDGLSVNRVQDNYVAQWGDASEKKPLPAGLIKSSEAEYTFDGTISDVHCSGDCSRWEGPTYTAASADKYAPLSAFILGWPVAGRPPTRAEVRALGRPADGFGVLAEAWPVHCYATVGVGRNLSPDAGTGAELYTVIGHAPRHLDRNIAVVGRVVEGIEHLSSLPRGTEALGFYKTAAERTAIRTIRLASDLPEAERPRFEYLSTESPSFAAYADARANRRDAFFIRPAGGADICNVPVPVRRVN